MLSKYVITSSKEPTKKLLDLKQKVNNLQHHQWMKLISKESPSKLKDPRVCIHHFHPSTLCAAANTTKLLPGAFPTINVTKDCPNEKKLPLVHNEPTHCVPLKQQHLL